MLERGQVSAKTSGGVCGTLGCSKVATAVEELAIAALTASASPALALGGCSGLFGVSWPGGLFGEAGDCGLALITRTRRTSLVDVRPVVTAE